MRKVLTRLLIPVVVLILAVVGTDFGFAIFAEYLSLIHISEPTRPAA